MINALISKNFTIILLNFSKNQKIGYFKVSEIVICIFFLFILFIILIKYKYKKTTIILINL